MDECVHDRQTDGQTVREKLSLTMRRKPVIVCLYVRVCVYVYVCVRLP